MVTGYRSVAENMTMAPGVHLAFRPSESFLRCTSCEVPGYNSLSSYSSRRRSTGQQVSGTRLLSSTGLAITSQQSYAYMDITAPSTKIEEKMRRKKGQIEMRSGRKKNKGKVQRRQNLGDDVMNRGSGGRHDQRRVRPWIEEKGKEKKKPNGRKGRQKERKKQQKLTDKAW